MKCKQKKKYAKQDRKEKGRNMSKDECKKKERENVDKGECHA